MYWPAWGLPSHPLEARMTMPFQTRQDFKNAGRAFAIEATDILAKAIETAATLYPETLTDEFVDALQAKQIEVLEATVAGYIAAGVPPMWALKFRSAFLHTASKRLKDYSLAAHAAAGNA